MTEMLVTAGLLSALAALCVGLLPKAPPALRFVIALLGLAVWIVPWPLIEIQAAMPGDAAVDALAGRITAYAGDSFAAVGAAHALRPALIEIVIIALFVPGLVSLLAEGWSHHRVTAAWRQRSRSGEYLRCLLPAALREIQAELRIVAGARVAAASGWIRPTIWVGDRLVGDELALALAHEAWHVRRRDPVWMTLIVSIRCAYWWNPLVRHLSRQAVLMMESACDRRCAGHFGRRHYAQRLASMVLGADAVRAPRLAAAASSPALNVLRLRFLELPDAVLRGRDAALVALLSVAASAVAAQQIVQAPLSPPRWSNVAIPDTPAGSALAELLGALHGGDSERMSLYLGAYTPQEVEFPLQRWGADVRLVEIVRSEPSSIEYLVRDDGSEKTGVGRLEVVEGPPIRVTRSELRDLGAGWTDGE